MSATTATIDRISSNVVPVRSVLFGAVGLALCVFGMVRIERLVTTQDPMLRDFVQEWTSARNWSTRRPVYQDLRESIPFHLPKARAGDLHFNAHPPVAVLLALPFGALSYHDALFAWNLLSLVGLGAALALLMGRRGFDAPFAERLAIIGILLQSSVVESQLLHGQLNCVLLLLIAAAWANARHERSVWAGVFVGLAAAIKLFPGLLLVYFVARRQWKGCLAGFVTFVLANLAACGILGAQALRDYWIVVVPDVGRFCDTWPNASLLGYVSRLFDGRFGQVTPLAAWPLLAKSVWASVSLLLVGLAIRVTARCRSAEHRDLAFAGWISLMLIVSPVTWDHYFLLAVPVLLTLWQWRDVTCWQRATFLSMAVLLLLFFSPYQVWHYLIPGYTKFGMTAKVATPWMTMTALSIQFFLSLAVFATVIQQASRRAPAPALSKS